MNHPEMSPAEFSKKFGEIIEVEYPERRYEQKVARSFIDLMEELRISANELIDIRDPRPLAKITITTQAWHDPKTGDIVRNSHQSLQIKFGKTDENGFRNVSIIHNDGDYVGEMSTSTFAELEMDINSATGEVLSFKNNVPEGYFMDWEDTFKATREFLAGHSV